MTDETKTIAFVLYPGITALDLVGPLQVLSAVSAYRPDYRTVVVAADLDVVGTDSPLRLAASHTFADVPAPDVVVVPGGLATTLRAMADEPLHAYLRQAASTASVVGSVCTGSLILAAAGLLEGRRATSHWSFRDLLARFGAVPTEERWVEDGPMLTAAGVSAGIDMAFHLAARLVGEETARQLQFGLEYDPRPPLGPLDWSQAPTEGWATLRKGLLADALSDHPELLHRLTA